MGPNNGHASQHRWTAPTRGKLKCNVDAAIFIDKNCFNACMCVKNEKGGFNYARTL